MTTSQRHVMGKQRVGLYIASHINSLSTRCYPDMCLALNSACDEYDDIAQVIVAKCICNAQNYQQNTAISMFKTLLPSGRAPII